MKIEERYNQGTASTIEDGHGVNPPFLAVIDGVSAPYIVPAKPIEGPKIRKLVLELFHVATPKMSLEKVVLEINEAIANYLTSPGREISGAAFVFAKINEDTIEIIQGNEWT